jgi:hypothetical protein
MSSLHIGVIIGKGVNRHSIVLFPGMNTLSNFITINLNWTHPDDDSARLVISTDLEI